jgi:hypothetical protein
VKDLAFHPRLVDPFYLAFINANILGFPVEEQEAIAGRFRETLPAYTDDLIVKMLRHSWRPAKVAAWVVAARPHQRFLPILAERLQREAAYAEHLCIALAAIGSHKAADILVAYLYALLPPTGYVEGFDEAISPDWALAALGVIDSESGSNRCREFLVPEGPWEQFVASRPLFGAQPSGGLSQARLGRLAGAQSLVPATLRFIRSHLS